MKEKFTYIIQGPLDVISLDTIDEYLKQDHIHEIIVSCWDNESITDKNKWCNVVVEENYELIEPHLDKVTFIKNKYPQDLEKIHNVVSYFRQINTLAALKKVKTKYCVVHKAGDSFPDMSVILNKFEKNPNKYYVTNRGCRTNKAMKFGMNHGFLLGETEKMIKARELVYMFCKFGKQTMYKHNKKEEKNKKQDSILQIRDMYGNNIGWTAYNETLETLCFLMAAGETIDITKSAEQVKKHYDITPMKDFKAYRWSQQFHKKDARSLRVYKGTRGMDYDKNFNDPQIANHIDEV